MMPGFYWQDCEICQGEGVFEYDTCRACMGEGGRWQPIPESMVESEVIRADQETEDGNSS